MSVGHKKLASIEVQLLELRYFLKRKYNYTLVIIDEITSEKAALRQLRHEVNSGETITDVSLRLYRRNSQGEKLYDEYYSLNPRVLERVIRGGWRKCS